MAKKKTTSRRYLLETIQIDSYYRDDSRSAITSDRGVNIVCPEFTCLCPINKLPDMGTLHIYYLMGARAKALIIERTSLRKYLDSFRNDKFFHEEVVWVIANDIFMTLDKPTVIISGEFESRSGISINPMVTIY